MAAGGGRLTTFVEPRPNRRLIRAMAPASRILMLQGIPGVRDIPLLNRIPGIRGLANVRHIDFPRADQDRLSAVCNPDNATFLTPNHPEFFTDWMIDKEIVSRVAPSVAAWATNGIVNGMGRLVQRFWLANNLIAQIPGNSQAARDYSIRWVLQGNGVLLHPEGAVGWHGDWLAPLMPGAAEMALQAVERSDAAGSAMKVWTAPIVWKLAFLHDVEAGLAAECAYVEANLRLPTAPKSATPAERIVSVYEALLARDEEAAGEAPDRTARFVPRLAALKEVLGRRLAGLIDFVEPIQNHVELVKDVRRWLRENPARQEDKAKQIDEIADLLQRLLRLGPFAWSDPVMTQEQAAEHLKRIRTDYCFGSWRDNLNRLIPQPVGARRAIIRVPEPIDVRDFNGDGDAITLVLRERLQAALDTINAELRQRGEVRMYANPFYRQD